MCSGADRWRVRSFPESQKNGYFSQNLAILPGSRIMKKVLDSSIGLDAILQSIDEEIDRLTGDSATEAWFPAQRAKQSDSETQDKRGRIDEHQAVQKARWAKTKST
jgi:hypothetical protein